MGSNVVFYILADGDIGYYILVGYALAVYIGALTRSLYALMTSLLFYVF